MSIVSVNIASTNIEGALFGIFFALSVSAMCLLVNRRWKEASASTTTAVGWTVAFAGMWRSTLFIASILLILVISTHWCLGVKRMFDAFIYYDSGSNPVEYYSDLTQPYQVARTAFLVFTLLIGDLVLVHRTWIVWNRNRWIALIPIVSSASLLASAIGVLRQFTIAKPTESVFAKKVTHWIIGVVVSTLVTKIYGTVMIAARIYLVNKSLRRTGLMTGGRSILGILMILIESSTLSTAWTVFFAIAYATKSSLQSFATGCSPAINGIAFMLITVRVGLGWDLQLGVTGSEESPQTATLAPFHAYPLRTIRLTVTRTVEQEADFALSRHSRKRSEEGDGSVLDIGHGKT